MIGLGIDVSSTCFQETSDIVTMKRFFTFNRPPIAHDYSNRPSWFAATGDHDV